MELISVERRNVMVAGARSILKLELRDQYAVDDATLNAWRIGDVDIMTARQAASRRWVGCLVSSGAVLRRVRLVSEPLSESMRFAFEMSSPAVDAGEDIRWLPRRDASTLLLPGNDFFVLDDSDVIFNVLAGGKGRAEQQRHTAIDVIERCRAAFEAAWTLAVPHREYRPAYRN